MLHRIHLPRLAFPRQASIEDEISKDPALLAVARWIRRTTAPIETIEVVRDDQRWTLQTEDPALADSPPLRRTHDSSPPSFVVWHRNRIDDAPGPVPRDELLRPPWVEVLRLRRIRVWEREDRVTKCRPLRFGLAHAQGDALLALVRRAVTKQLMGAEPTFALPRLPADLGLQRCSVAVALWTEGRLRGSIVSARGSLQNLVAPTARQVLSDSRFNPLSPEELERTRIQVSILQSPWVPIDAAERATGRSYPDKAALLSRGPIAGVFLPEIHNLLSVPTLRSMTEALANKVGLGTPAAGDSLRVCETTELVEPEVGTSAIALSGPKPVPTPVTDSTAARQQVAASSGDWLLRIRTDDGTWPQRVCVWTGEGKGEDRTRTLMTAEALAAFGIASGGEEFVRAAKEVRASVGGVTHDFSALDRCYAGKLAWRCGDVESARAAAQEVMREVPSLRFEPLVFAHVATFLGMVGERFDGASATAGALTEQLIRRFDAALSVGESLDLAAWAELLAALPKGRDADRLGDWFVGKQLDDGAFPRSTTDTFSYTRGTSKVFEALAMDPGGHQRALQRALAWLRSMQYHLDSLFFVPAEHRDRACGGFRHDATNTDAWTDAAGHVLLGLARWEGR